MAEPAAFFGLRISPGEVYPLETLRDVHITNIAFGEKVEGSARSVVKVHHIKFPNLDDDDSDSDSEYDSDLLDDDQDEDEEDDENEADEDAEIKDVADAAAAAEEEDDDEEDENEDDDEDEDEDDSDSGGVEEEEFVVCSLYPGKIEQCSVNLYFTNLEDVGFSVTGDNDVELLGNYMSPSHYDEEPSDSELYDSDEDDEEIDSDDEAFAMEQFDSDDEEDVEDRLEEIEEDEVAKPAKKAITANGTSKKRSNDEVDADVSMLSAPATDAEIAAVAEAEGIDVSKMSKNQRKRLNKKLKGDEGEAVAVTSAASIPAAVEKKSAAAAADKSTEKTKTKVEVTDARGKKASEEKEAVKKDGKAVTQKTKTASGLVIEEQKQGTGVAAKAGNRVGMRYVGRLQGKGAIFDSNTKGKPFFFKLGKGEVIKGWDEGVKGMKVGGERRLICPPALAYGRSGAPPTIPANATLVFDVKLVEIK